MRKEFLPFARPSVSEEAIADVADSIRSGWLTMGPKTILFEKNFAGYVGASYALAVNSATAGLHCALTALGIGAGDEVITTPMTFAATANAILFTGAKPVFADIDRETLDIVPENIERAVTKKTKAVMPVHFAGTPCDMDEIEAIADAHGLAVVEDAAHALGAEYKGRRIGADRGARRLSVFSFHPTKNITTGEGGMVCTQDEDLAEKIMMLRQNGMSRGAWNRYAAKGSANYDIFFPGLKYTMTDIQAAIGNSQLPELENFNRRRARIVAFYMRELADVPGIILPKPAPWAHKHSWHIFTPFVDIDLLGFSRDEFIARMKERNIGTALHYQALHLFSCYGGITGMGRGSLPEAEYVSDRIVSLPLFPAMIDEDAHDVVRAVKEVCRL
ncbi:DegT/DnrJ/EryC1/StrS family aminotransferase [Synergistes jonesii]|uniref:Pyridoxal phosphate-dependent aminotransferase n=1 Tax=Synergistes jonesii TaxID=2754 RepID=A0A073J1R3_9BACT|nr:DegT/DnrJ/EryC1/StrS family aminotransferase [Synergistes jonesii]KEJ91642.1 pyridoxal phosphate-dependent aminotransferase [Synergistes jonesii]OFB60868.1 pyridoxal phosphate-dependent aminotransferase [Synergistes jonesii]OFB61827.1 pyridoxal phosphate-dependent aminotransferase [Synergistes jonesii]OFB62624.1 pyridoxal phosphate-dependent aminotransferase [Synergistes jonesii]OFB66910.1 pyridoxal phosphate-dependent aminotransferase [Synergistes jonesii]